MQALSWASIGCYCLFGVFVFYQQLHLKHFQGASQRFAIALGISALLGTITGVAYLIYYGWVVVWWAPFVILVIGIIASILGVLIEKFIGAAFLSLAGFVGWPVSAYFMFEFVPRAT